MKSILLTTIEHFIMRSNSLFKYTNPVEIVPKISLIFRKIPLKFLKFCKNTPEIIPKISLIAARHPDTIQCEVTDLICFLSNYGQFTCVHFELLNLFDFHFISD